MTLSLFPTLLSYQQLSPVLIRLVLALIMIHWCYLGLKNNKGNKKIYDVIQGILGALILIGLWTQAAAGLAAIGFLICIIQKIRDRKFLNNGVNYMLILFVLAISLMLTGPGWFSFDLPL
jgi:hypothetical protein